MLDHKQFCGFFFNAFFCSSKQNGQKSYCEVCPKKGRERGRELTTSREVNSSSLVLKH